MPIPKLPVTGLDDINHRRRARETINQVLDHSFDDSKVRTKEEIAADVVPVNPAFPPGDLRRYGGIADGVTNNDGALAALRAVCAQGVDGYIPVGVFAYTTSPNWSMEGLTLKGDTGSELKHTGSGRAFNFDSGGAGGYRDACVIEGIRVRGNANTTDGFYLQGLVRSHIRFLEVRGGCTDAGFRILGGVASHFDTIIISENVESLTTRPSAGIVVGESLPITGWYTACCTFSNLIVTVIGQKGVSVIDSCSGNTFKGGNYEYCSIGLDIESDECRRNSFDGVWFEGNTTSDIRVTGVSNMFINCYAQGGGSAYSVRVSTGTGTVFVGGYLPQVELQVTSSDTVFFGLALRDGSGNGIIGGNYRSVGSVLLDSNLNISGQINDVVGTTGTFTPGIEGGTTPGTQTYAANGQVGIYTRINNVISFTIYLKLASNSGGVGNALITGFPAAATNVTNAYQMIPVGQFSGVTLNAAGRCLSAQLAPGNDDATLLDSDSGASSTPIPIGNIGATAEIILTGSYQV